ncbi:MAG: transposase, partial [Caulobacteraceae bacterium]
IQLYHDHGTSEQFHSEIKTDLDLESLPSGKFSSNHLVLTLGSMAYNLLRLIGQESIKRPDAPLRKQVSRRRIRTVIQNLITIAAKLVTHANKTWLKFGRQSPWFNTFSRIYEAFI